jgi:hypothetical protein
MDDQIIMNPEKIGRNVDEVSDVRLGLEIGLTNDLPSLFENEFDGG